MLTLFFTGSGQNFSPVCFHLITQNRYELGPYHFLNFSRPLRGIFTPNSVWTTQPSPHILVKTWKYFLATGILVKVFTYEIFCIWIKTWRWHEICTRNMTTPKNPSKTITVVQEVIFDFTHFGRFGVVSTLETCRIYYLLQCKFSILYFTKNQNRTEETKSTVSLQLFERTNLREKLSC